MICTCYGYAAKHVRSAIEGGAKTVEEVFRALGVEAVPVYQCEGCLELIERELAARRRRRLRLRRPFPGLK